MPRESVPAKAVRLLCEGRVSILRVDDRRVEAIARGDTATFYRVTFAAGRWACDCQALSRCSHPLAVQRVAIVPERA